MQNLFTSLTQNFQKLTQGHYKLLGLLASITLMRQYFNGPRNKIHRSLENQIAIVTGSSAGIGKETARDLLNSGATVIFACRNEQKTLEVIKQITNKETSGKAHYMNLDLTFNNSVENFVKNFSKKFDRVDLLINNAGLFNSNLIFTTEEVELTMQTNHCGHFLLTGLLLKYLKNSDDPRVINVSSMAHKTVDNSLEEGYSKENYKSRQAYGITKAANVLFTENFAEFCEKNSDEKIRKIKSASLHPGVVRSEFWRDNERSNFYKVVMCFVYPLMFLLAKDEKMGAQTTLHLCHIEREKFINGGYYGDCMPKEKHENLRKFNLEKSINRLTCEGLVKSQCYWNFRDEKEFSEYFEFFKTKC